MWPCEILCVHLSIPVSCSVSRRVRPRWEAGAGVMFRAWLFSLIKASQPPTTASTQTPRPAAEPEGGTKQHRRGKLGTEEGILMDKEGKPTEVSSTGCFFLLFLDGRLAWCCYEIKGKGHPKNENSVIIYSSSSCSKPVWVSLFCRRRYFEECW